jgi:hypothetical protein
MMPPSRKDILSRVEETPTAHSSTARRGFVSGALAALGIAGFGTASAGTAEELSVRDAKKRLEHTAQPLLERLSTEGLLEAADTGVLPDSEMTLRSETGAVVVSSPSGAQRAFVTETEHGKLEVNLGGVATGPYAIHRPSSGDAEVYLPDGEGGYESRAFDTSTTSDLSTEQVADCDGCDCYGNNSCWLADRVTICSSIEQGDCVSTADCGCKL